MLRNFKIRAEKRIGMIELTNCPNISKKTIECVESIELANCLETSRED